MDHLRRFERHLALITFVCIIIPGLAGIAFFAALTELLGLSLWLTAAATTLFYLVCVLIAYTTLFPLIMRVPQSLWQAIWHVSPNKSDIPPPNLEQIKFGRELITAMVKQVYELASTDHGIAAATAPTGPTPANTGSLIEQLPLAVFVLNKDRVITAVNSAGSNFIGQAREQITGKSVYDVLRLSFTSSDTFDTWLDETSKTRATDSRSWEHVRLSLEDEKGTRQFDMAATFSKDDSAGNEVVIALFDRTASYDKEDQATSYVALAVHELRTPLTVLRGYIEVFEDELGDQLTPELKEFMRKMSAAAQSLTAFVSNILNVARVDENQLVLSLHEANWNEVLPSIVKDLELRASVRGKTLELDIEPNLPTVGIDRISMYEVISNLVDNAIKYSGQAHRIVIHSSRAKDGTINTEVEDFGPGMPESAMSGLFTKFYRSHRSKSSVGGSGLGLFLVKSIVTAHGGNVWVNSREGEGSGSRFGFSLQTYEAIKASGGDKTADGIERQANGWIKNHSMYRR